jgi:CrcB protein
VGPWLAAVLTHPVALLTAGGALGTNARYWLGRWVAAQGWTAHFPLATLLINVSGSLLLGAVAALCRDRAPAAYLLLGVGFCGGYTTFSTFAFETVDLLRKGAVGLALLNVLASVLAAVAAVALAARVIERDGE